MSVLSANSAVGPDALSPSAARPNSARVAELVIVFFGLGAVTMVLMAATRRLDLFSHPLWLDETFTSMIANDPSFVHMFQAVKSGVDTNPPTYYFILWPIARIFGPIGNVGLRAISLLWILGGLTSLYATCRRFFSPAASIVAILAIWAHPLVIDQAFEARFYAPWFALTAWFCHLQITLTDHESALHKVARYTCGILATSIHYFGAISMGMIIASDLVVYRNFRRVIPGLLGFVAILACLPMLFGQRAGLSVPTWIDPVGASQIKEAFVSIFAAPSMLLIIIVLWISRLLGQTESAQNPRGDFTPLLPMSSLLFFPAAIVVFSAAFQPSLVLRYLIVTILPLAPMLASLMARAGRSCIVVATMGMIAMGAASILGKANATRGLDHEYAAVTEAIDRDVPKDAFIVFKRRREMYPVLQLRPELAARAAQLDFGNLDSPEITQMSRFERDMGRKVESLYQNWRTVNPDALNRMGRFYVIAPSNEFDELLVELPGFKVTGPDSILHQATAKE